MKLTKNFYIQQMIMNYEQKYKAALERMKSWVKGEHPECFCEAQKVAEFIFPELKESEDERIRKELIKYIKEGVEGYIPAGNRSDYQRWLDWLEKQSEQTHGKPGQSEVTKISSHELEPKFHTGDCCEWDADKKELKKIEVANNESEEKARNKEEFGWNGRIYEAALNE